MPKGIYARKHVSTSKPGFKRCGGCKEEKPADQFHSSAMAHDGLSGHCKHCNRLSVLRSSYRQMIGEKGIDEARDLLASLRERATLLQEIIIESEHARLNTRIG